MENQRTITDKKRYKELGHDTNANTYDGDRPSSEQGLGVDNPNNNLVSLQATARRKLDEYLINKGKTDGVTG